jgi:5-methylcytosine-specific restriction endonuclease McrA
MPPRLRQCFYCGRKLSRLKATKDHMQPRSKGGTDAPRNIVDACKRCNCEKGCLSLNDFKAVLALRQGLIKLPKEFLLPGEWKRLHADD